MDEITTEVMLKGYLIQVPKAMLITQIIQLSSQNKRIEFILLFHGKIFQNNEEQDKLFKYTVTSIS